MTDLGNILGEDFGAMFDASKTEVLYIEMDLIQVNSQVRSEFSDDDNCIEDLAQSIEQHGLLQPIVVRPIDDGMYALVAGERRLRAMRSLERTEIAAQVMDMTEEQAAQAQLAENIQRKNLTMMEEAQALRADVQELGIDGAMEKHNKGRAWFSKRLKLLNLPKSAKELVSDNVSADIEVISGVASLEKKDPDAAAQVVAELKETKGKGNARKTVEAAKKKSADKKQTTAKKSTAKKSKKMSDEAMADVLFNALFFDAEKTVQEALNEHTAHDIQTLNTTLLLWHTKASKSKKPSYEMLQFWRDDYFGKCGIGALRFLAFELGLTKEPYSIEEVLQGLKPKK